MSSHSAKGQRQAQKWLPGVHLPLWDPGVEAMDSGGSTGCQGRGAGEVRTWAGRGQLWEPRVWAPQAVLPRAKLWVGSHIWQELGPDPGVGVQGTSECWGLVPLTLLPIPG